MDNLNKTDLAVTLFMSLRKSVIEQELSFLTNTLELVEANRLRCADVMEPDEQAKTWLVEQELRRRIAEQKAALEEDENGNV